jgi:hypothetical protein
MLSKDLSALKTSGAHFLKQQSEMGAMNIWLRCGAWLITSPLAAASRLKKLLMVTMRLSRIYTMSAQQRRQP